MGRHRRIYLPFVENPVIAFLLLFILGMEPARAELSDEFRSLPESKFRAELAAHMMPVEKWATQQDRQGFDLLCLGETHDNFYRKFYARTTLPFLQMHTLALEEAESSMAEKYAAFLAGEKVELLGADLGQVLKAAAEKNPSLEVRGVDITPDEDRERTREDIARKDGSRAHRDGFIAQHFDELWKKGGPRIVALYGALHCSRLNTGFASGLPFFRLLQKIRPGKKIVSVLVLPPGPQMNLVRILVDKFDLAAGGDMALVSPGSIPPAVYHERQELREILESYDVILLPKAPKISDDR